MSIAPNTLRLHFSKKLKPFIGNEFFNLATETNDPITDEFDLWYGDIFYINRKKYSVFSNGLTNFAFIILDYQVDKKNKFYDNFKTYLAYSLRHNGFVPENYLLHIDFYSSKVKTSRSPNSHLSQLKDMCAQVLEIEDYIHYQKEKLEYLNHYINTRVTSYKDKKGYHEPTNVLREEWKSRGLMPEGEQKI